MPVDAINVNIQGPSLEVQQNLNKEDNYDAARKAAIKKIQIKKEAIKGQATDRVTTERANERLNQRMNQILGGAAGPEAQEALGGWQQNGDLQKKLTDAQKQMFRKAMAENPGRTAKSGKALNNLAKQPGFQKAVNTAQQAGTLQQGLMENPQAEKPVGQMLQSRFMQSPKADQQSKNNFLRFGFKQAQKGDTSSIKRAGDMLGSLARTNMPKGAQRASMNMVQRNPANAEGMQNVDSFVQNPNVAKMPTFARGKATELLAKADGKTPVKEGFEQLAADPKFKAQTAQNKGRFFSTIGTGRPSEYRALTDASLQALQSSNFPNRSGQVSKFLGKMAGQVQKGGAKGVDVKGAMKSAKSSPLPSPPRLVTTNDDMDPEEKARARSQNRAQVIQFYTKLSRVYEKGEKSLNSAKYLEDVNALQNLREPPGFDASSLTPEEQAFVAERHESVMKTLNRVRKLQRQKARELRTKRMPPAKRRAKAARRRMMGRQPKYFNPNAGKSGGTQAWLQASGSQQRQGLPQNPMRGQLGQQRAPANQPRPGGRAGGGARTGGGARAGGGMAAGNAPGAMGGGMDIQQQVASALSGMEGQPMNAATAGQVAQAIATSVAQQVAQQVTAQLMGMGTGMDVEGPAGDVEMPTLMSELSPEDAQKMQNDRQASRNTRGRGMRAQMRTQQGKVDGWGIPRSFEPDLGGTQRAAVRPAVADEAGEMPDPAAQAAVANEVYSGKVLIKDPSIIRTLAELFVTQWKQLNKGEMALLKNLGWTQQTWDTKDSPAAKWPLAMGTPFVNLNPTQRESVRKLGFTAHDWDDKVQALASGRNA